MAKAITGNPIILKSGMSVGSIAAETDDDFLFDCFVNNAGIQACLNIKSPTMVISGRTGAEKTAILRYIERNVENSVQIDPTEMSLNYVANSDALRFISAIGGDLDLLFLALWRHVLCLEFIRLKYNVTNETKSISVYDKIIDAFRFDQRRQKAVRYLKAWQGKFWITIDQNIKELTEKFEEQLKIEIGGEIEKYKAGGQYEKRLSTDKKSEILNRVKKIINSDQLAELSNVIEMLAVASDGDRQKFYILIDNLDDRWVDDGIRFKLIRALIDALKQFKKIHNLKIIAALRSDVLERVVQETGDLGFQREKFEEYFFHLRWKKSELKELIEKRISHTFKKQYSTGSNVTFGDIFNQNVNGEDPFDYMIERTLMRPRDIMSFINESFNISEGRNTIAGKAIKDSEKEYSRKRREALEYEWRSAFESVPELISYLSSFSKQSILCKEFCEPSRVDDLALKLSERKQTTDPIRLAAENFCAGTISADRFMKSVIEVLYRIGAIGVKPNATDRVYYSHIDQPLMEMSGLIETSRIRIHSMLARSMGVEDRESHGRVRILE